jgi:hypothetical protein
MLSEYCHPHITAPYCNIGETMWSKRKSDLLIGNLVLPMKAISSRSALLAANVLSCPP